MAVADRWHLSYPPDTAEPCKCGRGKNKLYPTKVHGQGMRWQVRYSDDAGKHPKRNFAERYGDDPERHAEAYDNKMGADLDADSYIDPAAGKITLERYAKQWRAAMVVDPSTLENIDKRLAHIYDVKTGPNSRRPEGSSPIAAVPMARLAKRPSLIRNWVKSLERKDLSPGYIKNIFDTLSSIFIAAIDDGVVGRNPTKARSVTLPRVSKPKVVPWTPEQVDAARCSLGGEGTMVDLGAGAGLRQGEIFGLAEEDIEFLGRDRLIHVRRQVKLVGGTLVFAPPKGGKERTVPLADSLALRLAERIRRRSPVAVTLPWRKPDGVPHTARLLFVRSDGRPFHRQTFTRRWHRARDAAGVPATRENGMHVLRHTYASAQLAGGVDIRTLAEHLGHDDPGFTLRTYAHLMFDAADRARNAVDAFLGVRQSALIVPSEGRD